MLRINSIVNFEEDITQVLNKKISKNLNNKPKIVGKERGGIIISYQSIDEQVNYLEIFYSLFLFF